MLYLCKYRTRYVIVGEEEQTFEFINVLQGHVALVYLRPCVQSCMMPLSDFVLDLLVSRVLSQYKSTAFRPSSEYQFTVLAAFVLVRSIDGVDSHLKVISLATGSKCLPKSRLPPSGDALHDSHAEVLARRGVIRWLYEEVQRSHAGGLTASEWIEHRQESGKYGLKDAVELHMYISTIPCEWS